MLVGLDGVEHDAKIKIVISTIEFSVDLIRSAWPTMSLHPTTYAVEDFRQMKVDDNHAQSYVLPCVIFGPPLGEAYGSVYAMMFLLVRPSICDTVCCNEIRPTWTDRAHFWHEPFHEQHELTQGAKGLPPTPGSYGQNIFLFSWNVRTTLSDRNHNILPKLSPVDPDMLW